MSKTNYCPSCGTIISSEDRFCSKCGTLLSKQNSSPTFTPSNYLLENYKSNIRLIAIIEIVIGIFSLITGVILSIVSFFLEDIIASSLSHGEDMPQGLFDSKMVDFITVLLMVLSIAIIFYGLVAIISGKKLLEFKNSGRIGTLIIAGIALINFPLGTVFGVVAFYFLTRPGVDDIFHD